MVARQVGDVICCMGRPYQSIYHSAITADLKHACNSQTAQNRVYMFIEHERGTMVAQENGDVNFGVERPICKRPKPTFCQYDLFKT